MNLSHSRTSNPILALRTFGQSIWLDYVGRSFVAGGALRRLIEEDGLCGLTSNPAIFEKAITGSSDYAEALRALGREPGLDAKERYEQLIVEDIQIAADALLPVYVGTKRRDGYVSLEVSPYLARDTGGTLDEAQRLWEAVGRDNVMIKVPATPEGIPAIVQLLSRGINVNVTLIFAQEVYELVADAYLTGLERFAARGGDVGTVASVASLFVSRVDTAADEMISTRLKISTKEMEQAILRGLKGNIAVANAKLAYQRYRRLFSGARWEALARRGATTQRLLWASTGTKNPNDRDVKYVEELIGPETVSTVTPATLRAFRDHGRPESRLNEGIHNASVTLRALQQSGISMKDITDRLLDDGLQRFRGSFDRILTVIEQACDADSMMSLNSA